MDVRRLSQAIVRLVELAAKLRGPDGCPWDAKQTDQSVKNYLLEEAYEVVDAVDRGDWRHVCGELGDLLFQIVFLAQLASERGEFEFADVVEGIERKMIHRHPHVFGTVKVKDAEEVARNWARIKKAEEGTGRQGASQVLGQIPLSLPALLRCHRICERASKINFEISRLEDPIKLVKQGIEALEHSGGRRLDPEVEEKVGCALFALAEALRECGENAEDLLRKANERFISMVQEVDAVLESKGLSVATANESQLKSAWEKVRKGL